MGNVKIACSIYVGKSVLGMTCARSECSLEHNIKMVDELANVVTVLIHLVRKTGAIPARRSVSLLV